MRVKAAARFAPSRGAGCPSGHRPWALYRGRRRGRSRRGGGSRPWRVVLEFFHREEAARGLDALEDLFVPGVFHAEIDAGTALTFTASAEQTAPPAPAKAFGALLERSKASRAALPAGAPAWIESLATAADQFSCGAAMGGSSSIIAGYPGSPIGGATP